MTKRTRRLTRSRGATARSRTSSCPAGAVRQETLRLIDSSAREFLELCGAAASLGGLAADASDLLVARR